MIAYPMQWWPVDSRVVDAPYLRRGDKVEIFRFADTKQYFWREMSTDRQLRRGERYRIAISANTQEDREPTASTTTTTCWTSTARVGW
jgi:hypothetical protein